MSGDITISAVTTMKPSSEATGRRVSGGSPEAAVAVDRSSAQPVAGAENQRQPKPAVEPSSSTIRDAVKEANKFIQDVRSDLVFQIDDSTHTLVVKVTDRQSGEVLRQIPGDEVLHLLKRLNDLAEKQSSDASGMLLKGKA